MHNGMPYDPIQVKVKVTSDWKPLKGSRPSVLHGNNFNILRLRLENAYSRPKFGGLGAK